MKEWLGLAARLIVGGVWIYAGALKIFSPLESVAAVRAYELLPGDVADQVGYALPAVELVLGIALVLGVLVRGAGVISSVLFVAFIIGIASVWARGMEIDCGCFGGGGAKEGASDEYPFEIARDVVLLGLSMFLVTLRSSRFALDSVLFTRGEAATRSIDDLPDDETDETDETLEDTAGRPS